jgi:hypothetical protein
MKTKQRNATYPTLGVDIERNTYLEKVLHNPVTKRVFHIFVDAEFLQRKEVYMLFGLEARKPKVRNKPCPYAPIDFALRRLLHTGLITGVFAGRRSTYHINREALNTYISETRGKLAVLQI